MSSNDSTKKEMVPMPTNFRMAIGEPMMLLGMGMFWIAAPLLGLILTSWIWFGAVFTAGLTLKLVGQASFRNGLKAAILPLTAADIDELAVGIPEENVAEFKRTLKELQRNLAEGKTDL